MKPGAISNPYVEYRLNTASGMYLSYTIIATWSTNYVLFNYV